MKITQGARANLNGRVFEQMIIPIFKSNSFEIFTEKELNEKRSIDKLSKYVIKNAPYKTIYGEKGRTELKVAKQPKVAKQLKPKAPTAKPLNALRPTAKLLKVAKQFVIVVGARKIRIEVKHQSVVGSVDEKYSYMLLNAIYQYPEKEIIFIVDGEGYKPGARKWLETSIKNNWLNFKKRGKGIKLMTITEFMNWFNHEFQIDLSIYSG